MVGSAACLFTSVMAGGRSQAWLPHRLCMCSSPVISASSTRMAVVLRYSRLYL